jgi:hypothetical protein
MPPIVTPAPRPLPFAEAGACPGRRHRASQPNRVLQNKMGGFGHLSSALVQRGPLRLWPTFSRPDQLLPAYTPGCLRVCRRRCSSFSRVRGERRLEIPSGIYGRESPPNLTPKCALCACKTSHNNPRQEGRPQLGASRCAVNLDGGAAFVLFLALAATR